MHPTTLVFRNNLAYAMAETGDSDHALSAFRGLVDDARAVLGLAHPTTTLVVANLVQWLCEAERFDEALELADSTVTGLEEELGRMAIPSLSAQIAIARAFRERHTQHAITRLHDVLARLRELAGPQHPAVQNAHRELLGILWNHGLTDEALQELGVAVEHALARVGTDHPETLAVRDALAFGFIRARLAVRAPAVRGRLAARALPEYRTLLVDRTRLLGAPHYDTLRTHAALAGAVGMAGDAEGAIREYASIIRVMTEVLGHKHPSTLQARENHAFWLMYAERTSESLEAQRQLLGDLVEVYGDSHAIVLRVRGHFADDLRQHGMVDEAFDEYQRLVVELDKASGPEDPATLTARVHLAGLHGRRGEPEVAVRETQAVFEVLKRQHGPDHPEVLTIRENLANWLGESRRPTEAVPHLRAILAARRRDPRARIDDVQWAWATLSEALLAGGDPEAGLREMRELTTYLSDALGATHEAAVRADLTLAAALHESGRSKEAEQELRRLLARLTLLLGPGHLLTRAAGDQLMSVLRAERSA
jgi:tetratricopeptide (TPR) repeat protein